MGTADGFGGGVGDGHGPFFALTHQIQHPFQGSKDLTVVSSPKSEGMRLNLSSSEEVDVASLDQDETGDSSSQSIQYKELLELVIRAVEKLKIDWPDEKQKDHPKSKLDEHFLHSKTPPPSQSRPFFPNLHAEVVRSWERQYCAHIFCPNVSNYSNILGLKQHCYRVIPRVEQTLDSYLSPEGSTMAVLLVCQADLDRDKDEGEEVHSHDIRKLRRAADLSLRATKETARNIGRSMAALVATKRHLWLNLSDIRDGH